MLRSEIAARAGCSPETLRHYEKIGLLAAPGRAANGYRHYEEHHVEQLLFIRTARELGFGLEEIHELARLRYRKTAPCRPADRLVREHLWQVDEKINQLGRLRVVLQAMLENCPGDVVADCSVFDTLSRTAQRRRSDK